MLTTGLGGLVCSYFYGLGVGAAARRARAHGPPRGGSPTRGRGRGCAHHHKKVAPRARAGGGKALRPAAGGGGAEGNHIGLPPARVRTPAIGCNTSNMEMQQPARKALILLHSLGKLQTVATALQQRAIVRYLRT